MMSDSRPDHASELSRIVARMQSVDVGQVSNNSEAQAELLLLARKLTAVLEGPINKATDLAFKASLGTHCQLIVC